VKILQADNAIGNRDMARRSTNSFVKCIALSGDGQLISSGHEDGTVRLWQATSGLCLDTFRGHVYTVHSVIFSPDSRLCASSSADRTIRVWDNHTHAMISTLDAQYYSEGIRFSPNCSQLLSYRHLPVNFGDASSWTNHLDLWEIATGDHLASTQIEERPSQVTYAVDGTSVIAKFANSAMEWKISPAITSNRKSLDGDHENDHSMLPMVFVPIHGIHQPPSSTDLPAHQPCYQTESEWILDEQKRRICWLPSDLRSLLNDSNGKKIALVHSRQMVTIIDFSGVR